ncbi:uncharacterized protein YprB with RNaseH-like and TPR domain [Cytobacillus eiseniae]|uniref:Uncharacterized protein YprB with RNaseH-like and TPR domain n=1 Tax=Cytobacillus eiseniae TaxID=762947 RepID=A0ABS4REI7_9BACI|nr:ribonuclease H-like domain-containing protein [Cytobacillus eiseniae]MBP2241327.1 uncharacterized protein YprB with RNaseH-like and TPR domain [Cytobacillus eiseniae]
MSIKKKLNRLKSHMSHEGGVDHTDRNRSHVVMDDIPYRDVWEKAGVTPYYFEGNYCLIREVVYPIQQMHGNYSFSQFIDAVEAWNHHGGVNHPLSAAGFQAENFFFFDTETTGLGGGVGNSIFILGHASLSNNSIHLKQHILPQPGAEVPLYKSFLESADYTTMATYNGKSFDWPQVKTQHTLIRNHLPKLPEFGHFDLYHASRRMWKHKLERLKLAIVEKEVLGIARKDDLPGFLAPMIYFDFVENKDPQGMLSILKHNEIDILSLITLYTHLSFQILGLDKKQSAHEKYEVGRWFSQIGEASEAKQAFMHVSKGNGVEAMKAKHALAFENKKQRNWQAAIDLWKEVVNEGEGMLIIEACIELAKIYEHREKNFTDAIAFTKKAEKSLQQIIQEDQIKISISLDDLTKRSDRLSRKIQKQKRDEKCL